MAIIKSKHRLTNNYQIRGRLTMATIKIVDLNPVGSEFFADSESYLNELTDDELNMTQGGTSPILVSIALTVIIYSPPVYVY
jgi:hypothetical protein